MAKNTLWIRFACAMLMAMVSQYAAAAITYSVDSVADDVDDDVIDGICHTAAGKCTLRAAVMQANVNSSAGGSIILLPAGTYLLTRPNISGDPDYNGDLDLTSSTGAPISIVGAGSSTTIIDAQQIDRVFNIHAMSNASISDLTIANGDRIGDTGGGIENDGQLTMTNVIVRDSTAGTGGGISNSGELHLLNVVLHHNIAQSGGGGLSNGGLSSHSASLVNCSIDANRSPGGVGGGIFSDTDLTISNSSLTRNSSGYGGGMEAFGVLTVLNSTIASNTATVNGGGLLYAAGEHQANLYNTTIAYNEADSDQNNDGSGGGLFAEAAVLNLYNSLIAGNYHIDPAFADDCDGAVQTHAFNRFGNTSQCTITQVSGSYTTLNSLDDLGPLQNNGGPTETVALLAGSNAIDGAAATCLDAFSQPITTDQRGFPRNVNNCDIGAYEYGAVDPNDVIFSNGFEEGL